MGNNLKSPLVKVVVPVILGTVLFIHLGQSDLAHPAFFFLLTLVVLIRFTSLSSSWKFRWLNGVLYYTTFVVGGYVWTLSVSSQGEPSAFHKPGQGNSNAGYILKVISDPEVKKNYVRAIAGIIDVIDTTNGNNKQGIKCLLYFKGDTSMPIVNQGDYLVARADMKPIDPPSNPGEFDFQKYMARKGVCLMAYLDTGDWKITGHQANLLNNIAFSCREFIYERLENSGISGQEFDLAASLLLGQKDGLEQDVRDSFSSAGAMHVLCVSGLHVGIIFVIVNILLKGLRRSRPGRVARFLIVLLFIWTYALVTGLSPSVMRASLMFSFLQSGKLMNNPPPTTNSLAASAFILIMINPMVITNIGFQFSYLAVYSIIHFMPLLQSLWQPQFFILNKTWSLVLVSLAAQIGTGPLSVHYFHQFPVWFLLTNMIVIPLASVIIYLAVVVIAIPWHPISEITGFLLNSSLKLLSGSVKMVEQLPGSVIASIPMSSFTTIMIYLFLFLLLLTLVHRSRKYMFLGIAALIVLWLNWNTNSMASSGNRSVYVYSSKGFTNIDLMDGNRCYAFS